MSKRTFNRKVVNDLLKDVNECETVASSSSNTESNFQYKFSVRTLADSKPAVVEFDVATDLEDYDDIADIIDDDSDVDDDSNEDGVYFDASDSSDFVEDLDCES